MTNSPTGVETPASKLKSSQEDGRSSSVLFERTLAIRQGIHSPIGTAVSSFRTRQCRVPTGIDRS
ncbi:MAG: hypothetical protein EAZ09_17325 [Oscillatoriales cyanobacterium]|nr:MAG: hypothetical protein EAZ09_17325 [Oscillatoriales cyanobacterium]